MSLPPLASEYVDLAPQVKGALATGGPVVALESTIVTHGMPFPRNVEMARSVEEIVRRNGATPATIAVMDGRLKIGLSGEELERLAAARGVMKLSRADLAYAIAMRRFGATTVAATMMAAELAGIEVFATGGIGGVHRGAETSFDISADLTELGRTSVITVCAGAKAILDLPKTLEVLETEGVPVLAFGTSEFPAFWSRGSGLTAPLRADDPAEIAAVWRTRKALGQKGGMLIANPVAKEHEIPFAEMAQHISHAITEAQAEGVGGKAVTPWLLARILDLTEERSLATNIALVENNAMLAARIAVALAA